MTSTASDEWRHRLLQFLPAVYHTSPMLATFLSAFEPALFAADDEERAVDSARSGDGPRPGLEAQIDRLPGMLDPATTDEEFVQWLGQWAAISLLELARDPRHLIAAIIPLYGIRGTRDYVRQVLELYLDGSAAIEEEERPGIALGIPGRAGVGTDSRLGEDPFSFHVRVQFHTVPADAAERSRLVALARAVVDLSKPAYTHYRLTHNLTGPRGFVIAVRSRVGIDTHLDSTAKPARRERLRP